MISRRLVLIFIANVLGGLLGYAGLFAIARFTPNSEELLGFVGFGLGFVGSFFVLTSLGVPAAHIKRISQGESLEQCIGAFSLLKTLQVGLATAATLLALYVWTEVLGRGFETPLHLRIISTMLLYYIAMSAANICTTTFNARLETVKTQVSLFTGTITRVVGMIVVALAGFGALALAWAYVFGAVAVAAMAFVQLRHYPFARPPLRLVRSYLKFALPLAIPGVLISLSATVDKAVIQLFWGVAEVGYYFAVQRIILLLTVITSAVSLLLFPTISQYHTRNELDLLRTKSEQAERYLSMALAPVAAFLAIYPEGVIHVLLSDAFLPATNILRLFAIATFVLALVVPRQAILQGTDRPHLAGMASLAGAVVTLTLYVVLIPTSIFGVPLAGLGPEGAAASVLVGYVVLLTLALTFSHRLVGDRLHGHIFYHVAAAAAVALLFSLLISPSMAAEWRWFHLMAFGASFLGAYLALLTVVGEFRKPDLLLFLEVLDPRKMAKYVQTELRSNDIK